MIVERGHVGLIISGRRTQTRKLVDQREPGYRVRTGRRGLSHSLTKPWIPKVGDRLPIKTAGERAELYVVVTGVRTEPASAITSEAALACGYMTVVAWKAAWVREHDKAWVVRERLVQEVRHALAGAGWEPPEQNIRASLVDARGDAGAASDLLLAAILADDVKAVPLDEQEQARVLVTLTAAQLAARFDSHHADHLVWVIDHAVATDEPFNLLAARPGSAGDDYVRSATAAMGGDLDPGEAVDRETVARLGQQAQLREQQGVTREWLDLRASLEHRIAAIKGAHTLASGDMKYLRNLERVLDSGDRRFGEVA